MTLKEVSRFNLKFGYRHGPITQNVMLGMFHCFGLCWKEEIQGDIKKHCVKLTWKSFLQKNRRQQQRGQWYYDKWLIDKVRHCVYAFSYQLTYDIDVFMPKKMFPLLVAIHNADFFILIAPRKITENLL